MKALLLTFAWYIAVLMAGEWVAEFFSRPFLVSAVFGGLAVMVRFVFCSDFFEELDRER